MRSHRAVATRRGPTLAIIAALLAAGCLGASTPEAADVMVPHEPLRFLAASIAGDNVTVDAFIQGVAAHDFEPSVRHAELVADAGLVVRHGAGFDTWLGDVLQSLGDDAPPHVVVTEDVRGHLIVHGNDHEDDHGDHDDHGHEDVDPHTWTDPLLMVEHVRTIEAAMVDRWPEHAPAFHERADRVVAELQALDQAYREGLDDCATRTNVVSHNAFAYLGARYNLTFHAIHGLSQGTEPSADTMDRLKRVMEEENVTTVLFEELVEPRVAQALADETGARTDVLSPAETRTAEEADRGVTYLTKMQGNLAVLRTAMRCT